MTRHYPETEAVAARMREKGIAPSVVESFCVLYERYRAGESGKLPWGEVERPRSEDIVSYAELGADPELLARGQRALRELVVIRLNGGLGTTMALEQTKSLIPVREGRSFLDLVVQQVLALRAAHAVEVPLLAMNSFRTREETEQALAAYPGLAVRGLPLGFLQNQVPRIQRASGLPAAFADEETSWAPPGHGDIYGALASTGLLRRLLDLGIRWAFVANVDNLGATVDPAILGYLESRGVSFAMEVTDKSLADIKGGTLVRHRGRLTLLEAAQVEPEHLTDFQDIKAFSVFNTNNLWWRLDALEAMLERGGLELPLIINPKQIRGVEIVQLEQAMGAAVGCFTPALGIQVPRRRFAPVKATCDLLALRSDAYLVDEGFGIRPSPARDPSLGPPVIVLDPRYKGLDAFEARFPAPLSLLGCRSLRVEGDLRFGRDVVIEGEVTLRNPLEGEQRLVPDGARFASGVHVIQE
jgi:UTP--glucose-1-phosphate uridylyltransferase